MAQSPLGNSHTAQQRLDHFIKNRH
jgi:hypothetical protein